MLNFRNTTIGLLLGALLLWFFSAPVYSYGLLLFMYSLLLFWGSYRVDSQFYMPVTCKGNGDKKEIALSFDDGPHDAITPAILDVLKEKQVPAAFFCIGNRIIGRESLLQRTHQEGHLVGNHSYSHHTLFDLYAASKMEKDLRQMNKEAERVLQLKPNLFRPPYGVTNPNVSAAVQKTGMKAVGWNIRSLDTIVKNESRLFAKLLRSLQPGAIILFHDTKQITLNILPQFIDEARRKGYEFVRLDTLINEAPYA
ncbi:polysaccharide deacetylase family protein [Flavihumibacter profundi]|jgi:peptidoglycan-N-acetylglucosamine deacetylase|uniref:polysaccharide deacetylase family protein n=1 Tax=Flavihumibacter profundi TaxID=2716883 RepID=UPI001CC5293B|nr:polysaccharide deacetylase family protein [Flavihumibacter profundi]MBZ5858855.1 polysaccharide deacetylase family protein [Flavihumibacter profundi]